MGIVLSLYGGFVGGYMVCSILGNRDKKDKETPFKDGIRVVYLLLKNFQLKMISIGF